MNILFIGDVVSFRACEYLRGHLGAIKSKYNIDFCIANAENSDDNNGVSKDSAQMLFMSGADVLTSGNHVFKNRNIYDYFDENENIIRPLNFPDICPGNGYVKVHCGKYSIMVVNIMGNVFMDPLNSPFYAVDKLLERESADIIIVDFHAEATSEKAAMGHYLDSRVSAVIGTHTHVQTADEKILPHGSAYITDVGMCGPKDSILGVKKELIVEKFIKKMPVRFEFSESSIQIDGVVLRISDECKVESIERVSIC